MQLNIISGSPVASVSMIAGENKASGAINRSAPSLITRPSGSVYAFTKQVVSRANCKGTHFSTR